MKTYQHSDHRCMIDQHCSFAFYYLYLFHVFSPQPQTRECLPSYSVRVGLVLVMSPLLNLTARARRMWVHTGSVGDNNTVSIILSSKRRHWNRAQFRTYFRLTKGKFDLLLQNVGSTILRAQTTFRDAMSSAQRLCISLWWVAMPTAYSATIGCLKRSHSENIDALLKSTKIVDSRTKYPDHPEKRLWVQCFFSRQLQASAYALSSLGAFEINQKKTHYMDTSHYILFSDVL